VAKKTSKRPTESELEILSVLWRRGPATVREVHEALAGHKTIGYTTTLKMMQLMHEKGLLARDASQRSHVYRPALSQAIAQRTMLRTVLDRVFGGSAAKLVVQALGCGEVSPEELAEIRQLLGKLEGEPQ
jgi:BlaI family transcriptional regulator, penicillinase repressor